MVDGCLDIYRGYFGPANKFGDYELTHCGKPDLDKPGQHYDIHLISLETVSWVSTKTSTRNTCGRSANQPKLVPP